MSQSSVNICNKAVNYTANTFFLSIDICRQDNNFCFVDDGMIPIEDGFGDDMPVARDGPLDFSTPYVRTHFPETWLWIDTKTR